MIRTTQVAGLTLTAVLVAPVAQVEAATLGEVAEVSAIGEPLRIEIHADAPRERIESCIRMRAPSAVGDGVATLTAGRVAAARHGSGMRIVVTDPAPAVEPVLRFALENVCDARLRRDYTVLLAPPQPLPPAAPASMQLGRSEKPSTDPETAPPPRDHVVPRSRKKAPPAQAVVPGEAEPKRDRLEVRATEEERTSAPGETETVDERETRLVASVDLAITRQIELMERIRRLEEIQAALVARLDGTAPAPTPAEIRNAAIEAPAPHRADSDTQQWPWHYLPWIAALAAAAVLAPALRRRSGDTALSTPPPAPASSPDTVWNETPVTAGHERAPITVEEEYVIEAHESAIKLAELMLGSGRLDGATETLAAFIRANPRQAVTPWLRLLELYRAAGLRAEFDSLSGQLNKIFNVKPVSWERFEEARRSPSSVEHSPHLVETVQRLWGTPECQAFLEKLLRDNRDGTRTGFPIAIIDEILLLSAILERQLGPYRAPEALPDGACEPPQKVAH